MLTFFDGHLAWGYYWLLWSSKALRKKWTWVGRRRYKHHQQQHVRFRTISKCFNLETTSWFTFHFSPTSAYEWAQITVLILSLYFIAHRIHQCHFILGINTNVLCPNQVSDMVFKERFKDFISKRQAFLK